MSRRIAFDTETHLFRVGCTAPRLVCGTWASEGWDPSITLREETLAALRSRLLDPGVILVGLNIAFDLVVCCAEDETLLEAVFAKYEAGLIEDVRVNDKLILLANGEMSSDFSTGKTTGFSMADIYKRRFYTDLSAEKTGDDAWRLRYWELDGTPLAEWPDDAKQYALDDAGRTLAIRVDQLNDCTDASRGAFYDVVQEDGAVINASETSAAAFALALVGAWGLRTDSAMVAVLDSRLADEVKETKEALIAFGLFRAKDGTKDTKRLKELVNAAYGGEPPKTAGRVDKVASEKAGMEVRNPEVATDKDTLLQAPTTSQPTVRIGENDVPVLRALESISAAEHNRTTYIPALSMGGIYPITPNWNELVESGRTSCWKPNIQNLPRKGGYRECFVPRPGYVYVNTDYSTLELCALAQFCLDQFGHSKMAEAINEGRDLHLQMAAEILDIPYEQAVREYDLGSKEVADIRQMSKALNFGFPGGLGAETAIEYARTAWGVRFAAEHTDAILVVKQYKKKWLAAWPEMREFFDYVAGIVEAGGGRARIKQPRSGRVRGGVGYCDGCNSHFQGLAADGAKAALFYIQQECYTGYSRFWTKAEHGATRSPLYGTRIVAFIHDEFLGEAPEALASASAERLATVARLGMELYIPDVKISCSPVIMRRWLKGAKTVRDSEGRVAVWEQPKKTEVHT